MNCPRSSRLIAVLAVAAGVAGASFRAPCAARDQLPEVRVSKVRRAFDNGEHNAFTDLIRFRDAFFLTFRSCADGHGVSPNASVIVLRSSDLMKWQEVHRFRVAERDTRDPHFLIFKKKLFIYTGTWFSGKKPIRKSSDLELNLHLGYGVVSDDGLGWSDPRMLDGTFGHYVWRAAAFGGKAYLCGRRKIEFKVGPRGEPNEVESIMLESEDGFVWRKRAIFQEIAGDETAFLFEDSGEIVGIGRQRGKARLLRSAPPWREWRRTELSRFVGGPLITKWGKRTLVGGRRVLDDGPRTALYWLVDGDIREFAVLPSGGDTSYPGFVALGPTRGVVSWYSTHEGVTAIYLADLEIVGGKL